MKIGPRLTPADRAMAYAEAFPKFPAPRADARWLDGVFILGNLYKGNGFYGGFPPGALRRIQALFPDVWTPRGRPRGRLLHLFSGSLPFTQGGVRVDVRRGCGPDVVADAQCLPLKSDSIDHVLADPPYSDSDAAKYGPPMPNRRLVLYELARVVRRGGHVIWMDEVLPMFAKRLWHWWGVIGMTLGTNRRGRFVFMFERVGGRL